MAKVAIATTDGINIDEHFGRTKEFFVYEVDEQGDYILLEQRLNNPLYSSEHKAHTADVTSTQFGDIKVILISQIGLGATKTLRGQGVVTFSLSGSIDKALKAYAKRGKILESTPGPDGRCQSSKKLGSSGCSKGCRNN